MGPPNEAGAELSEIVPLAVRRRPLGRFAVPHHVPGHREQAGRQGSENAAQPRIAGSRLEFSQVGEITVRGAHGVPRRREEQAEHGLSRACRNLAAQQRVDQQTAHVGHSHDGGGGMGQPGKLVGPAREGAGVFLRDEEIACLAVVAVRLPLQRGSPVETELQARNHPPRTRERKGHTVSRRPDRQRAGAGDALQETFGVIHVDRQDGR